MDIVNKVRAFNQDLVKYYEISISDLNPLSDKAVKVYDSKGNDFLVKDSGIIPAFKNIKTVPNDPLSKELISYRNNTKTMELMNGYLPCDNSKVIGGALRRYLNNEITREELLAAIEEFWKQN